MKKAAIIFLALIVWVFLVPGAFAGQYMVILVEVESGQVRDVYDANALASQDTGSGNPRAIVLHGQRAQEHRDASGNPLSPPPEISRICYETIFAVSSPGCRYIWHPAGYWVKVCTP